MSSKVYESRTITESTLIPISMVITILGGSFGFIYVYFQTDANAKAITEMKAKQDALADIKVDIGIIKTKVENIEKKIR